jgi:hypothetical protein
MCNPPNKISITAFYVKKARSGGCPSRQAMGLIAKESQRGAGLTKRWIRGSKKIVRKAHEKGRFIFLSSSSMLCQKSDFAQGVHTLFFVRSIVTPVQAKSKKIPDIFLKIGIFPDL